MMSSNLARLIFIFGVGQFFFSVKCQPTMEHLKQEFQRVAEEEEFCFFYFCNRSEQICATKTFGCLQVFPNNITDQEKIDLCLDLIEKGDKSVLTLERSIDVCRYRLGKSRNSLGSDSQCTPGLFFTGPIIVCIILLVLILYFVLPLLRHRNRQRVETDGESGETALLNPATDETGNTGQDTPNRAGADGVRQRQVMTRSAPPGQRIPLPNPSNSANN